MGNSLSHLIPLRMTGRCRSGAEADGGVMYHAVEPDQRQGFGRALCGAKPGVRGNGWSWDAGDKFTCPRCVKRLERRAAK